MATTVEWTDSALLETVERRAGTPVSACVQCHKCSTGCPVGPEMDLLPSQVMRLIHLGQQDEVLSSKTIWLCASCEACTTRCPMGIDIAAVMDTLRILAIERGIAVPDKRTKTFNASLLRSARWFGRVYELGMMADFKLRSLDFFSDVDKAPRMLAKRKLPLIPHISPSAKEVRQVFKRAEEEEKKR